MSFDAPRAAQEAERGMGRAAESATQSWRQAFERAVCRLAELADDFTADDVRRLVGDPPASVHPNAAGALMNRMAKLGVIRQVGYARSSRVVGHSNLVRQWAGSERAATRADRERT